MLSIKKLRPLVKQKCNFRDYFRQEFPDLYKEGKNSFSPFRDDGKNPDFQLNDETGYDHVTGSKYFVWDLRGYKYNEDSDTAVRSLAAQLGIPSKEKVDSWGKLIATYDYINENGKLHVQHLRYKNKIFPWQRPDPENPGIIIKKDVFKDFRRIPYRLPQLLESSKERPVIICEGEKDAENTAKCGFTTTTFGGKNDHSYALKDKRNLEYFRERTVWLIADKDCTESKDNPRGGGYIAFRDVAGALTSYAKEVRLFLLPGGRKIKDASDLIELHGPEEARQIIETQAKRAPVFVKRNKSGKATPSHNTEQWPSSAGITSSKPNKFQMLDECVEPMDLVFFFDQNKTPWVSINIKGYYENLPAHSSVFRRILRKEFYNWYRDGVGEQTINNFVDARLGLIEYSQPPRPLYIRSCWNETRDKILIDSGRPDWAVFEIGPDGWKMIYLKENPFKRAPKTGAYSCEPTTARASWDNVFEVVRVKNEIQKTIAKMWLTVALFPETRRPGLVASGPHGAGKSSSGKYMKQIVDPATNTRPKRLRANADDMIAALAGYAVSVLDNVTGINTEMSDLLCLTIDGADDEKRRLFTDNDVFNTEIMCTWILTSLNNPGKMGDFLSRVFLLEFDLLPEDERIEDEQLKRLFETYLPGIQALVFDCMCQALKNQSEVVETKKPRLSQAYVYSLAMANKLGVDRDTIRRAWESNRVEQDAEVSANEILTDILPEFIRKNKDIREGKWEGTATRLFEEMVEFFDAKERPWYKNFPLDPANLSKRLNKIQENLVNRSIALDKATRNKERIITLIDLEHSSNQLRQVSSFEAVDDDMESMKQTVDACNKCPNYQGYDYCLHLDGLADPDNCNVNISHFSDMNAA